LSAFALFLTAVPVVLLAVAIEQDAGAPRYPDRKNLLLLRAARAGSERPVRKASEWKQRREHILANIQQVMGPLPGPEKRVPLDIKVESEERTEKYLRRKISFASAPGERVPAFLLIPTGISGKAPGILALHQTVKIGKEEPVGLGGSANLHYGRELAERGYVVLAPDYPTLGEHQIDAYARGWASVSMKAIWDNMRAIDLLQSLPEVRKDRIGCLGHSLGGHNTLFTAAFDTRIQVAVSNCGFTSFAKYYGGNLAGWAGERYMPRIKTDFPTPEKMPFEFAEVIAAIAPRAVLASAPVQDSNFEVSGVRDVIAAATPVFELLGKPERLHVIYPQSAHDWIPSARNVAYTWIDRWLR
jgi:dienelactone hydrolase